MDSPTANMTIPEIHRANNIIWFAMIAGAVMMSCILIFMTYQSSDFYNQSKFLSSPFMYVALGVTLMTIVATKLVVEKRVQASTAKGLKEKFEDFRANFILNAALHEGPTLICIIFMMLEHNFFFLVLAVFNLVFLYLTRPTLEKFKTWYQLTSEENQELKSAFPNTIA